MYKPTRPAEIIKIISVFAILLAVMLLVAGSTEHASAQRDPEPSDRSTPEGPAGEYAPGELLVKFADGAENRAMTDIMAQHQATYVRNLYHNPVQLWQVPEGRELDIAAELTADPRIEYAEPNYIYHAFDMPSVPVVLDADEIPDDPYYINQWGLPKINAPQAWDVTTGSATVIIAILDTGVDPSHPDLVSKLVPGHDFVDDDTNPMDDHGHGTHVAGIAAAATDNATGIAGVCWECKIMPVRVLNADGSGSTADITEGIMWASENGAQVLNLSLGGPDYSLSMQAAVTSATSRGSLVVAAMGNDAQDGNPIMYPAAFSYVVAVAATGPYDTRAYYSQYGYHTDIAAPGGDMNYLHDPDGIFSILPTFNVTLNNYPYYYSMNYDYLQGTSQATPHVSGVAGLLYSLNPGLSPAQVEDTMTSTAIDLGVLGKDIYYGWGLVDAHAAVVHVAGINAPVLDNIANTDGDGIYTVDWSYVPGSDSYTLQEDDNPSFSSPETFSTSVSQMQISGMDPGTWYYRVRAVADSITSAWSNVKSVTVKPDTPTLDAIDNLDNTDAYTLTWSTQPGAASYTLQEDDNFNFSSPAIRYIGSMTSYEVTGQREGDWYYRVLASNAGGDSDWSNSQVTTVDPLPYNPPTLNPIENADRDDNYTISWTYPITSTEIVSVTGYILEESSDPYFVDTQVIYDGEDTEKIITGQPVGTWYYRVRSYGAEGFSPWSSSESVSVDAWIFMPMIYQSYQP